MARIDVHYRFLSSYVHPISDRHAATYGRNRPWPQYDHFASELILPYVITLAVREVRSFEAMCGMQPQVVVRDAEEMRRECQNSLSALSTSDFGHRGGRAERRLGAQARHMNHGPDVLTRYLARDECDRRRMLIVWDAVS